MGDALPRIRQLLAAQAQHAQLQMVPETIEGAGSLFDIDAILKEHDVSCAMVVTTSGFMKRGTLGQLLNSLLTHGITTAVFSDVESNFDFDCAERAAECYVSHGCDAIVAIGGGSVLDCAKLAGAHVARPGKPLRSLVGSMKVRKETPLLIAVPTTAGSGSEATASAYAYDPDSLRTRCVRDLVLIPNVAVLDPTLLTGLSPHMTACTGMNALVNAIEAYINRYSAPQARSYAAQAVEAIFLHLKPSFDNGKDMDARSAMIQASFCAGIAATNCRPGYAQALSNGICGRYQVQSGQAKAVLLPYVLEEYGSAAEPRLAELAEAIGLEGSSSAELANGFIEAICALRASVGLACSLPEIDEDAIPALAAAAEEEANPSYPVPEILRYSTLQKVLRRAKGAVGQTLQAASGDAESTSNGTGNQTDESASLNPSDAPEGNAAPKLSPRQLKIAKPGPLLDDAGRLAALGYATSLVLDYNRRRIKASPLRIKEWDYYLVNDDSYAIALTIGDMGYAALVSASLIDFRGETFVTQSTMDLLPLGRLGLPRSSRSGTTSYADKKVRMSFEVSGGLRRLLVSFDDFKDGKALSAEIVLDREPEDSMVIATPWAESDTAFYYNQKIIGMRAIGSFTLGELRHDFREENSLGLLDWGRGVWTHDNTWYWSAAQGRQGGKLVGFNLGYGFGDTSAASENMLFVDGRAHKLDLIDFGIPPKDERARAIGERFNLMEPWHITDNEHRVDLVFTPRIDRCDHMDFKVVVSDQHQVFGSFDGHVVLDDGSRLDICGLKGFAEAVHNVY